MNKTLFATMLALGVTVVSTSAMAFDLGGATARQGRGADNPVGHMRQGRGADDPVGHIRRGRGADDIGGARGVHADGHISGRDRVRPIGSNSGHGRGHGHGHGGMAGSNSGHGHGMGAVGTTNPAGHVRGGGRDDRTGDAPRLRGEDGGVHQCRGCDDPTSGRDRVRTMGGIAAAGMLGR
jgi:hypothetical protein